MNEMDRYCLNSGKNDKLLDNEHFNPFHIKIQIKYWFILAKQNKKYIYI
jgi:hypothetical protein